MRYPLRQEDREAREEADAQRLAEPAMAPLEARIAVLEAALRPFADFYTPSMGPAGDDFCLTKGSMVARKQITVGDVRRAHEVLQAR